ncbi:uncharacterized protein EDB91DRAFT_1247965 [Suillus paluster]|uniref:uncharacterized protein n=1 Tax=Suillus paluster TaxID=48578 RepID=UPI001B86EACE|nr:uncharacterized protein EDB91DRAFT_1247965 [Suillus paluster]KAG1741414.1 hypothetical protein EDB91DRAFT_1247965 [Suillus paluster]
MHPSSRAIFDFTPPAIDTTATSTSLPPLSSSTSLFPSTAATHRAEHIPLHMNNIHPPVLIVGAGPAGLVAVLLLVQNGVRVCIIDKDPNPRIGQRGPRIWYKPGTLEPLAETSVILHMDPTPAVPFHLTKVMGQQFLDVILRRHLEKFSCSVEMGTELLSFEQSDQGVTAVLAKNGISETFDTKWMIGADGAKGTRVWHDISSVNRLSRNILLPITTICVCPICSADVGATTCTTTALSKSHLSVLA